MDKHYISEEAFEKIFLFIPPKSDWKVQRDVDYGLYKERPLVGSFFSKESISR